MPKLDHLYKAHVGKDIYVVGTGPSLRLFPFEFLKDKITIGLNQAYRHFDPTYSLTIHPYLIPLDRESWKTKWLTKQKVSDQSWYQHSLRKNDQYFYLFKNGLPQDFHILNPSKRPENTLYVGCGIHTGGIHTACLMGAKSIFLVGCDFDSFENQHHAHPQHIEPHQHSMTAVYLEYFFYAVKVRQELQRYYKVTILNLGFPLGLPSYTDLEFQYAGLKNLPEPKVVEYVKRDTPLICDFIQ